MKNKGLIIGLSSVAVICLGGLTFFGIKSNSYNNMIKENKYPSTTKITIGDWNTYATSQTAEDIFKQYIEEQDEIPFIVILKGKEYTLDLTENFNHKLKVDDFEDLIQGIPIKEYIFLSSYNFELKDSITCDYDAVVEKLTNLLSTTEYEYTEPSDASFDVKTGEITESVDGTKVNEETAAKAIQEALKNDEYSLNLDDEKFYTPAAVTTEDIKEKYADVIDISNWTASYGVSDYVIKMKDYMDYITVNEDGTYSIDTSFMVQAVLELSKTVDKVGADRKFKSTLDGEITVSGGTYGQCMSNKDEIEYLTEQLNAGKSVENREPVWIREPESIGSENTYVEIDISAQHVWLYKDGSLVMDTPCVTGTAGTSRATPTGSYYISEMVDGKYLVGATYRTWVNKWMRLTNDGVGLHDAAWRASSEFGGNTYTYDGSHGCINLPKSFAYDLYDNVKVGMLVVVHD